MGSADYLKLGDWNVVCSMCGRKRKASELVKNWQGMYRCPEHNEGRHPQEFVRGVAERDTPPWIQVPSDFFIPQPAGLPGGPDQPGPGSGSGSGTGTGGGGTGGGGGGGGGGIIPGCTTIGIVGIVDYAVIDCAVVDFFVDLGGGIQTGCTLNGTSCVVDYAVVDCAIVDNVPNGLGG